MMSPPLQNKVTSGGGGGGGRGGGDGDGRRRRRVLKVFLLIGLAIIAIFSVSSYFVLSLISAIHPHGDGEEVDEIDIAEQDNNIFRRSIDTAVVPPKQKQQQQQQQHDAKEEKQTKKKKKKKRKKNNDEDQNGTKKVEKEEVPKKENKKKKKKNKKKEKKVKVVWDTIEAHATRVRALKREKQKQQEQEEQRQKNNGSLTTSGSRPPTLSKLPTVLAPFLSKFDPAELTAVTWNWEKNSPPSGGGNSGSNSDNHTNGLGWCTDASGPNVLRPAPPILQFPTPTFLKSASLQQQQPAAGTTNTTNTTTTTSTTSAINRRPPPIHIYVKGSTAARYFVRAKWIAHSWGQEVKGPHARLTFVMDTHNVSALDDLPLASPPRAIGRVPTSMSAEALMALHRRESLNLNHNHQQQQHQKQPPQQSPASASAATPVEMEMQEMAAAAKIKANIHAVMLSDTDNFGIYKGSNKRKDVVEEVGDDISVASVANETEVGGNRTVASTATSNSTNKQPRTIKKVFKSRLEEAFAAQRLKLRWVLSQPLLPDETLSSLSSSDASSASNAKTADNNTTTTDDKNNIASSSASPEVEFNNGWVCYLDDDLVVNVSNLVRDLVAKQPLCTPNCYIAHVARREGGAPGAEVPQSRKVAWSFGGWCMEAALVRRLQNEFLPEPDAYWGIGEESNVRAWHKTDDFGLAAVLRWHFDVFPFQSDQWVNDHRPPNESPMWYREDRRHLYAVYHQVELATACAGEKVKEKKEKDGGRDDDGDGDDHINYSSRHVNVSEKDYISIHHFHDDDIFDGDAPDGEEETDDDDSDEEAEDDKEENTTDQNHHMNNLSCPYYAAGRGISFSNNNLLPSKKHAAKEQLLPLQSSVRPPVPDYTGIKAYRKLIKCAYPDSADIFAHRERDPSRLFPFPEKKGCGGGGGGGIFHSVLSRVGLSDC